MSETKTYRVRINGLPAHGLEHPLLIGRDPRPPRVAVTDAPDLITLPEGDRSVSATHLEIRQVGSSVVITDMRSTNGTIVTAPGCEAHTLLPGGSMVAGPGTLIEIGDGNLIEILSIQRASRVPAANEGQLS